MGDLLAWFSDIYISMAQVMSRVTCFFWANSNSNNQTMNSLLWSGFQKGISQDKMDTIFLCIQFIVTRHWKTYFCFTNLQVATSLSPLLCRVWWKCQSEKSICQSDVRQKRLRSKFKEGSLTLKLMQISWQIPEQYLHYQGNKDFDAVLSKVYDS